MGLDMYLYKSKRGESDHTELAYWRKANHIHAWFVDNCQDGNDDCRTVEITRDQLESLLSTCLLVFNPTNAALPIIIRETIAEGNLPTRDGFFFGSVDYDAGYFEDVEYTIEALTKALEETDFEKESIHYTSSW